MSGLAAPVVTLALLLAACNAPPAPADGAPVPAPKAPAKAVWQDSIAERNVFGDWVAVDARSTVPPPEDARMARLTLPGWVGLTLRYDPGLIRLSKPPSSSHDDPFAITCTQPRYTANFADWPAPVDNMHRQVPTLFGFDMGPGQKLYGLECNGSIAGDAELSAEEMGGPAYLFPYDEGRIILIWATGEAVLFRRAP